MAEEKRTVPLPEFGSPLRIPQDLPTYFVDGIFNLRRTGEVVRWLMIRIDPSEDINQSILKAPVQLAMSETAFFDTLIFLESFVEEMKAADPEAYAKLEASRKRAAEERTNG